MNEARLATLPQTLIAYDRETDAVQPGLAAPPPVLGSAAELGPDGKLHGVLLDKAQCRALFQQILDNPQVVIAGANIVFDFLVEAVDFAKRGIDIVPQLFAMYDPQRTIIRGHCDGRVFEVQLAEALHAIAQGHLNKYARSRKTFINKNGRAGRYSLDIVTQEVTGREDAKTNDRFRLSYHQFHDVPLDQLPFEARQYPIDDAKNTAENALAQAGHMPSAWAHDWQTVGPNQTACVQCRVPLSADAPDNCMIYRRRRNLHDLARQAYFAWAAYVGGAWGFNVNQEMVDKLEKKYTDTRDVDQAPFRKAGIIRENGTEDQSALKRLVAIAYGARDACPMCQGTGKVPSPKTAGKTKINCDACDGTSLSLPPTVPRSAGGGISKDHDSLQESGDDLLMQYGEQEGKKILSTYIPLLRRGRACNVCGRTGVATKSKPAHEDWCAAQKGESGYRKIPLLVKVNPLVETGRTSVEEGLHGLPRKGGVRECIEARPGYVLSSIDYTAGELVTVSWACLKLLGFSRLAEVMQHKLDPHLALAGTMSGRSYEEMVRLKKAGDAEAANNRQGAKNANFGFWGGMAELTFVLRKRSEKGLFTPCPNGPDEDHNGVRGYNGIRPCIIMDGMDRCGYVKITTYNDKQCPPVCKACVEAAKRLRGYFMQQWLEAKPYFDLIKKLLKENGPSGTPEITHLVSRRVRGGLGFCDGANGIFQGLLADAAKDAFCQIQRECCDRTIRVESSEMMTSRFAGGPSPLLGSRAIMLPHDETLSEHPESVAHEAATRVSEIMVESLRFKCPENRDAVQAPPAIMRRLYKGAEPRYARGGDKPMDENDRLIPWEP